MRMLGKKRAKHCRYKCCWQDGSDGKKQIVRRNKRRERQAWRKQV